MIFLAFPNPVDAEGASLEFGQRRGLLQLIHVAGSDNDATFRILHSSPSFCHMCVSVPDLEQAMGRMKTLGVEIIEEGSNDLGYGAIVDPDGYSIQLLHCEIDQSLALKRQLEEMMTLSSSSSNRRPSASSQKDVSLTDLTRTISAGSSCAAPLLQGFRGGSPNFEHPHWLSMQKHASAEEEAPPYQADGLDGHGDSIQGDSTATTRGLEPSSTRNAKPLGPSASPHTLSLSLAQLTKKEKCGRQLLGLAAQATLEPTGSSSSSSSGSSSRSNRSSSSVVTSGSSRRLSRASSPGSSCRPNAPTSIDLSRLTSVGRASGQTTSAPPHRQAVANDRSSAPSSSTAKLNFATPTVATPTMPTAPKTNAGDSTRRSSSFTSAQLPLAAQSNTSATKGSSSHSSAISGRFRKTSNTPTSFRSLRDRLSGKGRGGGSATQSC